MPGRHFISYSRLDAENFALRLYDALLAGPPSFPVWLDQRDERPGEDWDEQLVEALRTCESLLFVMTRDSTGDMSGCKDEWASALKYKKPIVPLLLHPDAELPYRVGSRQYLDCTGDFGPALARLRQHLQWLASPDGLFQGLRHRQADATRDLQRARDPVQQARIQAEIDQLEQEIARQQRVVADPQGAAQRTAQSVARGLERERQPEQPAARVAQTRFINPPPMVAPSYFQDRHVETGQIGDFLRDDARRLLTVVGRAGIGKTALVCRLLQALERGQLPDAGGALAVDGIVYLGAAGGHRVDLPTLYADLCRLLPDEQTAALAATYQDSRRSAEDKMAALLAAFPAGRTLVLLDNFEDVVDQATLKITDAELDAALRAVLRLPRHGVKVILTTRVAPRPLALLHPERQGRLNLDEGLPSPYAERILRAMDVDGTVGLRDAPDALLAQAQERTRGYPRALEALYAILAVDRDTALGDLLAHTERLLPENVVEAMVGEAFDRLDRTAERALEALAICGRPVPPAAVDYLLQPYVLGIESAPVLGRLVAMQFAHNEAGRYSLHPVDRAYALSRIPEGKAADQWLENEPPFSRFALRARAADYFRQVRAPRETWTTITDLAPQLAEFDLRCENTDYDTAAGVLLEIDYDYLLLWGHYRLLLALHERLQGKLHDAAIRLQSLINLGTTYFSMGQYLRAIGLDEQALTLARETGDRRSERAVLGKLGTCYQDLGQVPRAIGLYKQALTLAGAPPDRRGEGIALTGLGTCYRTLGQVLRAKKLYEQALDIDRELRDERGEGVDLTGLGNCYWDLGQYLRAKEHYEQALTLAGALPDRRSEGIALGNLGACYQALGQYKHAIGFQERALALARELDDRYVVGSVLTGLADVAIETDRLTDASRNAQAAADVGRDIGSPAVSGDAQYFLALVRLLQGDLRAAGDAVAAACRHATDTRLTDAEALRGVIALHRDERATAREAFAAALARAERLLRHNPQNHTALDTKGLALCGLALCDGKQHVAAASEAYLKARSATSAPGIVSRALRLFDALAALDGDGVLVDVRTVIGE